MRRIIGLGVVVSSFYLRVHLFLGSILAFVTTTFLEVGGVDLCGTHFSDSELVCGVHAMNRADSTEVSGAGGRSGMSCTVFGILE